jgi:hypothetical protein
MALIAVGCKKAYKEFRITDPVLKTALDFKEGSYFIYRDKITGIVDSCNYEYSSHSSVRNDQKKEVYESVETSFATPFSNDTSYMKITYGSGFDAYSMDKINVSVYVFEEDGNINTTRGTIFNVPQVSSISPTNTTFKSFHERLLVDTISYDSVYEYETNRLGVLLHSYFSLKYGIVRMITFDSQKGYSHDWMLINSKIFKE